MGSVRRKLSSMTTEEIHSLNEYWKIVSDEWERGAIDLATIRPPTKDDVVDEERRRQVMKKYLSDESIAKSRTESPFGIKEFLKRLNCLSRCEHGKKKKIFSFRRNKVGDSPIIDKKNNKNDDKVNSKIENSDNANKIFDDETPSKEETDLLCYYIDTVYKSIDCLYKAVQEEERQAASVSDGQQYSDAMSSSTAEEADDYFGDEEKVPEVVPFSELDVPRKPVVVEMYRKSNINLVNFDETCEKCEENYEDWIRNVRDFAEGCFDKDDIASCICSDSLSARSLRSLATSSGSGTRTPVKNFIQNTIGKVGNCATIISQKLKQNKEKNVKVVPLTSKNIEAVASTSKAAYELPAVKTTVVLMDHPPTNTPDLKRQCFPVPSNSRSSTPDCEYANDVDMTLYKGPMEADDEMDVDIDDEVVATKKHDLAMNRPRLQNYPQFSTFTREPKAEVSDYEKKFNRTLEFWKTLAESIPPPPHDAYLTYTKYTSTSPIEKTPLGLGDCWRAIDVLDLKERNRFNASTEQACDEFELELDSSFSVENAEDVLDKESIKSDEEQDITMTEDQIEKEYTSNSYKKFDTSFENQIVPDINTTRNNATLYGEDEPEFFDFDKSCNFKSEAAKMIIEGHDFQSDFAKECVRRSSLPGPNTQVNEDYVITVREGDIVKSRITVKSVDKTGDISKFLPIDSTRSYKFPKPVKTFPKPSIKVTINQTTPPHIVRHGDSLEAPIIEPERMEVKDFSDALSADYDINKVNNLKEKSEKFMNDLKNDLKRKREQFFSGIQNGGNNMCNSSGYYSKSTFEDLNRAQPSNSFRNTSLPDRFSNNGGFSLDSSGRSVFDQLVESTHRINEMTKAIRNTMLINRSHSDATASPKPKKMRNFEEYKINTSNLLEAEEHKSLGNISDVSIKTTSTQSFRSAESHNTSHCKAEEGGVNSSFGSQSSKSFKSIPDEMAADESQHLDDLQTSVHQHLGNANIIISSTINATNDVWGLAEVNDLSVSHNAKSDMSSSENYENFVVGASSKENSDNLNCHGLSVPIEDLSVIDCLDDLSESSNELPDWSRSHFQYRSLPADFERNFVYEPPENDLQKHSADKVLSEHQLRVQRSLQKLNLPDWYKNAPPSREGFILKKRGSDASPSHGWAHIQSGLNGKTTSLGSLGGQTTSSYSSTGVSHGQANRSPLSLAPQSSYSFTRWSTSRLNSAQTSPCSSARSSVRSGGTTPPSPLGTNRPLLRPVRQPYLGWRSQERLATPRTPHERLAVSLLPAPSPVSSNVSAEIQSSIQEVTNAIVHYVTTSNDSTNQELSSISSGNVNRQGSPRLWLESSFVGTIPLESPQTPVVVQPAPGTTPVISQTATSLVQQQHQQNQSTRPLQLDLPLSNGGGTIASTTYQHEWTSPQKTQLLNLAVSRPSPGSTTLEDVLDSLLGLPSSAPRAPSPQISPRSPYMLLGLQNRPQERSNSQCSSIHLSISSRTDEYHTASRISGDESHDSSDTLHHSNNQDSYKDSPDHAIIRPKSRNDHLYRPISPERTYHTFKPSTPDRAQTSYRSESPQEKSLSPEHTNHTYRTQERVHHNFRPYSPDRSHYNSRSHTPINNYTPTRSSQSPEKTYQSFKSTFRPQSPEKTHHPLRSLSPERTSYRNQNLEKSYRSESPERAYRSQSPDRSTTTFKSSNPERTNHVFRPQSPERTYHTFKPQQEQSSDRVQHNFRPFSPEKLHHSRPHSRTGPQRLLEEENYRPASPTRRRSSGSSCSSTIGPGMDGVDNDEVSSLTSITRSRSRAKSSTPKRSASRRQSEPGTTTKSVSLDRRVSYDPNISENVKLTNNTDLQQSKYSLKSITSLNTDASEEVMVQCRYTKCTSVTTQSEAKKHYKNCHNCSYMYCSRECRRAHWEKHRKVCLHSRASALCKQILSTAKECADSWHHISVIAQKGYLTHGRGVVKAFFTSPESAEKFLTNGFQSLGEPVFVKWPDLMPNEMGPELYAELVKLCKSYNPETKLVLYVAVCIISEVPTKGAVVKWERQLVSRCAKIKLSKTVSGMIPHGQMPFHLSPKAKVKNKRNTETDYRSEVMETLILTSNSANIHNRGNISVQKLREISFNNIQSQLSQRGVNLKKHYPEVYSKLCAYVEGSCDKFMPMTVYPRNNLTGKSFMCVIMPETEPDKFNTLPKDSVECHTVDVSVANNTCSGDQLSTQM